MAQDSIDNIGKKIFALGESGKSIINDPEIQKKIQKARTDAERIIRKHPLASIGVGILAGYLIGRIFRSD